MHDDQRDAVLVHRARYYVITHGLSNADYQVACRHTPLTRAHPLQIPPPQFRGRFRGSCQCVGSLVFGKLRSYKRFSINGYYGRRDRVRRGPGSEDHAWTRIYRTIITRGDDPRAIVVRASSSSRFAIVSACRRRFRGGDSRVRACRSAGRLWTYVTAVPCVVHLFR